MDYKVTDSELTGIANAIRTKGGTSSPLVFPNGFSSAIADIPSGSAVLTTKNITQNGTYNASSDNADGYSSVTVNVSGGSSGILIPVHHLSSSNIVGEFEGKPIRKSQSDASNVYSKLFDVGGTVEGYYASPDDAVYFDLGNVDVSHTLYGIVKSLNSGGNYQGISSVYQDFTNLAPNIFTNNNTWNASVYGNDSSLGILSNVFHVLTIALDASNKNAYYYVDGVLKSQKSFQHCGRYPSIGGGVSTYPNNKKIVSSSEMEVLYGACASEFEDSSTIIANHQTLLQVYSDYIGT